MQQKKPEPYAYVLLAVIVIAAVLLIPVIWKLVKGILKIVLTLGILGFAIYGIAVFAKQKKQ